MPLYTDAAWAAATQVKATDHKDRLKALVATDRQPIRAEAPAVGGDDKVAVLRLYDPVDSFGGDWGVSAKEFVATLDELPDTVEEIHLHINSPGGEVYQAIALLNALRAHKARVVAIVDGVAASSASFIAVGADEVVMARNSELFIHDAWGLCVGNAAEMRKMADELDHFSENIASIYAAKAGGDVAAWRAAMADETWYSADQAVEAGLADRIDEGTDATTAKARFDLSIFKNSGRKAGPQEPVATHVGGPTHQPAEGGSAVAFSDEQLTHLRQMAGVADDADEATILDALKARTEETPPPETNPLPEGVVAIDAAQLAELRNDAQAGRDARAEQLRAQREQVVTAAVNDGRIAPARRDHWVAQLEADPGAEAVLASLEKGLIPLAAKGTEAHDLETDDERAYNALFGKEVAS